MKKETQFIFPKANISCGHDDFVVIDLPAAAAQSQVDLDQMPYLIRILLENLYRNALWSHGKTVTDVESRAAMHWQNHIGSELSLHVSRVILPDSSGIPVLQDLAALRNSVERAGGDPNQVEVKLPVHLVVDHSLQVDFWGSSSALELNLRQEFSRNDERYSFIKWAQQAFRGLQVYPPGTGIIHQINLEQIAQVVTTAAHDGHNWAFPDFVIGCDSHTPMVNAVGVLGWGVGGIDAEAALLGRAYTFPLPEVVGVKLHGTRPAGTFTTDLALRATEILRGAGVVNAMIEFFGPAIADLSVPERATLSNMAPEYGATCAYFPIDVRTLEYLRATGRSESHVQFVEAYCRRVGLFRTELSPSPKYSRIIEIDLSTASASMAGPRRPQDRLNLQAVRTDFRERLAKLPGEGGFGIDTDSTDTDLVTSVMPRQGAVVIAAITSCTNTSNPEVMIAAGLVAKKAVERGLKPPQWVKTSLAPGSQAVAKYLTAAGLLEPLAKLGFDIVGYGCTTCGGKSGPLPPEVASILEQNSSVGTAVLSGNRNFEGRIHKLVRANYIGAPPFVVIYALAGRIDIDLDIEPLGFDQKGQPVLMKDLLPSEQEMSDALAYAAKPASFSEEAQSPGLFSWNAIAAPVGPLFAWDPQSTYLVEPPFFRDLTSPGEHLDLKGARALAMFGDSLTTDHISPGGEIPIETPAGQYLLHLGVQPRNFNTYVARRGNHEIMTRATFANIRIHNFLAGDIEGGFTRYLPDDSLITIFDAAKRYREGGTPVIILAGRDYGSGSSRDWAAKGTALLGIRAVIAESFERIHRANLVGMGVLPLTFRAGEGWQQLGLTGNEEFTLEGIETGLATGAEIDVLANVGERTIVRFKVLPAVLTASERSLMKEGGIPRSVMREYCITT